MHLSMRTLFISCAAAAMCLTAGPVLAGHGKAGLWNITIQMQMEGVGAMPDMSKLPPEVQAKMRAAHVQSMGGHTMTVQHCMTKEEAARDTPPVGNHNKDCKMENMKTDGNSFSSEMVCTGELTGKGHMQVVYDTPEHYSGEMTMQGTSHGRPVNMYQTFEGKWAGAVCKGVTN
jgi:hypothetical protein